MAYGRRVVFEPIREAAFGAVGVNYTALGAAIGSNARIITISNSLNLEVYISFDGINDHLRVAPNSFKLFDLTSNKVRDDGYFLSSGTVIYQKQVSGAPASGSIWAEVVVAGGGV